MEYHHDTATPALMEQGLQLFIWVLEKPPNLRSYE